MRRLGAELGVQPSALYHHFANKQTLLAAVADEILARGRRAHGARAAPGTSGCVADVHRAARRDARLPRRRRAWSPRCTPSGSAPAAPYDELVEALTDGGFDDDLARTAARTLLHFVFGHTGEEQTHLQAGSVGAIDDGPRERSDFELGLTLVMDGIRLHHPARAHVTVKVVRVGVTPLKGARHRALDAVELDAAGAVGDRVFCLVDPDGRRVLRTVQHPTLPAVLARWDGAILDLTLPSGESVAAAPAATGESVTGDYWGRPVELALQDGPHAALLSDHLGVAGPARGARRAAPSSTAGSVSVVTTASVRALAAALGLGHDELDPARFRATVVVEAGDEPFVEDDWAGRELRLGAARVRVAAADPALRGHRPRPGAGGRDLPVLQALGTLRPAGTPAALCLGVDAGVSAPGVVRAGDPVSLV